MLNNDSLFKKKVSDFNNLDLILQIHISIPQVHFSDEPPDAYLYEGRDVWTMIDKAEVIIASLCGFLILLNTPSLQYFNF